VISTAAAAVVFRLLPSVYVLSHPRVIARKENVDCPSCYYSNGGHRSDAGGRRDA